MVRYYFRSIELLKTTYSLGRTDVPSLLDMAGYDNLAFVEDLVLGTWTPDPPQCLRRVLVDIIKNADAAGGGGEGGLSERCVLGPGEVGVVGASEGGAG